MYLRQRPARVLIYDPGTAPHDLAVRVGGLGVATVTVIGGEPSADEVPREELDLAMLGLSRDRLAGLSVAVALSARCPWIETMFWYDDPSGVTAAVAARSLGITRVLPLDRLMKWLEVAFTRLAAAARARRELLRAQRDLPAFPSADLGIRLSLPEAERGFREAYLRRLLSEEPNHAVAAQRAGVPYTTLCSMIKKLDLG